MFFRCAVLILLALRFILVNCVEELSDNKSAGVQEALAVINFDSLQFLQKYNYKAERHKVVTDDGYKLNIFRIPSKGPPVLLVHGIGDSSDSWLVLGKEDSLACGLADAGYDVWLFNSRGNKYGNTHLKKLPKKKFWDFTFEEMGTHDLPSVIDYILRITSRKKLTYVGYSQGSTIFFIMCSLRPEYNNKINHAVLLAPVAWIHHSKFVLMEFYTKILGGLQVLADMTGLYEIFPVNDMLNLFHVNVCNVRSSLRSLCEIEYYVSFGLRYLTNLPSSKLPTIASHIPAGLSSKTVFHFLQNYGSKRFQRYDYGNFKNQMLYNSSLPPEYDVSQVRIPLSLIRSETDWFSDPRDVEHLKLQLKTVENDIVINETFDFTHIEFVYGKRVNFLVNKPVINLLQNLYTKF